MKFAILGEPIKNIPNYRGIKRDMPSYVVGEDEGAEINQLFFWSTEIHGTGYLTDVEKGKRLIQLHAERPNPIAFEMIELTYDNADYFSGGELIGYDFVSGTMSLIEYGMLYNNKVKSTIPSDYLVSLIVNHYRPQLNKNLLFNDYRTANECLNCMTALSNLIPDENLWEMRYTEYQIVGLYKINLENLSD